MPGLAALGSDEQRQALVVAQCVNFPLPWRFGCVRQSVPRFPQTPN